MKYSSKSNTPYERNFRKIQIPRDYAWKVLGFVLDDLSPFLDREFEGKVRSIIRRKSLVDLKELSEAWGLQSMYPNDDISLSEQIARYQLAVLLKKFQFETERKARIDAAVKKFSEGEDACHAYNLEGYKSLLESKEPWIVNALYHAKQFMRKLLGDEIPGMTELTDRSRHGPGATTSTTEGQVSSYFKYENWPYDCTSAALRYARELIRNDERWLGALEDDYRTRFNIPKWVILDRRVFWDSVFNIVDENRIAFVPKNAWIERSIAIEPTINVMLQLGADGFIRRRLKRWGVDLDSQKKNQRLARLGSKEEEDPFCTLDLVNASNSTTKRICEILLPYEWYYYLLQLRSPKGTNKQLKLSFYYGMISSMGNGYTFALESAIFTACIYGVMMATEGHFDRENFAVFGDDLIVREHHVDRLVMFLSLCGFAINTDKSFRRKGVRESCGTDWVHGTPVRPVFLETKPNDAGELIGEINKLQRMFYLRFGLKESKTVTVLTSWLPEVFQKVTGPCSDESFESHLHSFAPQGHYRDGLWEYMRLVFKAQKEKGCNSFLFRKLMHDLRPKAPEPSYIKKRKLTGGGSRFAVVGRNTKTVGIKCSRVGTWPVEYTEFIP